MLSILRRVLGDTYTLMRSVSDSLGRPLLAMRAFNLRSFLVQVLFHGTMKSPTNTTFVPRGGWSVEIPRAGPAIVADNFSVFIRTISSRLQANGLDKHGWKEWALHLMCEQRPDIPCVDTEEPAVRETTGDDIIRFVRTMYETWQAGATAVSDAEQDRRASICENCPKRAYISNCVGCGKLANMLSEMTVGSKAKGRPELHKTGCGVCGCEISSLIMFPLEVLQTVDAKIGFTTGAYPSHCWKLGAVVNASDQPQRTGE